MLLKRSQNFEPKVSSKKKGQIQLDEKIKRQIIQAYLDQSQRTPNNPAVMSTYKVTDDTLVKFYDDYCHRKPLKNKQNQPTNTERLFWNTYTWA